LHEEVFPNVIGTIRVWYNEGIPDAESAVCGGYVMRGNV